MDDMIVIAVAVVFGVLVLCGVAAAAFICRRRKSLKRLEEAAKEAEKEAQAVKGGNGLAVTYENIHINGGAIELSVRSSKGEQYMENEQKRSEEDIPPSHTHDNSTGVIYALPDKSKKKDDIRKGKKSSNASSLENEDIVITNENVRITEDQLSGEEPPETGSEPVYDDNVINEPQKSDKNLKMNMYENTASLHSLRQLESDTKKSNEEPETSGIKISVKKGSTHYAYAHIPVIANKFVVDLPHVEPVLNNSTEFTEKYVTENTDEYSDISPKIEYEGTMTNNTNDNDGSQTEEEQMPDRPAENT